MENTKKVIIEKLIFGGKGLAHLEDGRVVLVVGDMLPGEEVEIDIYKKKKDYFEARVSNIITQSPLRIKAACPYFGKCGGCTIQSLEYINQLNVKQEYIQEVIDGFPELKGLNLEMIKSSEMQWHYRHKIELTFFAENDGSVSLGFFYKGTWFRVIDVDNCLLFDEHVVNILNVTRQWFEFYGLRAFHNKKFEGLLRNLIIKRTHHTNEWMIGIVTSDDEVLDTQLEDLYNRIKVVVDVKSFYHRIIKKKRKKGESYTDRLLNGDAYITERLHGLNYRIRFADFFQNNTLQAEEMITYVLQNIDPHTTSLLDLYCGVGTFTLPIAHSLSHTVVTGIELVQTAIDSADENASLNGIHKINFICSDVGKTLEEIESGGYGTILVDPPRAGLTKKVVESINNSSAEKLIYISCNPSTLARDIAALQQEYKIKRFQPFDLFPQTYHVECICILEK